MTDPAFGTIRKPKTKFEVRWNGTDWVDETQYVVSHAGQMRINAPGDELVPPGDIAGATVTLWNDGRFSRHRTDSPLLAYIGGGAGMFGIHARLSVGFEVGGVVSTWHRIFTGIIYSPRENTATREIALTLRDIGFLYVQERKSTIVYLDQPASTWIDGLATLAGITLKIIDASPYTIPYCWLDDESVLTEMWAAANSDGGRLYFNHEGYLIFEQAAHWAIGAHQVVSWSLTEDNYELPEPTENVDDLVTKVSVEVQQRSPGAEKTIYSLDKARVCPPGETITFDAKLQSPALSILDPVVNIDYRVTSAAGSDLSASCVMTLTKYAQRVIVVFTNNHASLDAYLVNLTMKGIPLVGGPTVEVKRDVTSPAISFKRDRGITGNQYIQTEETGAALAEMLADRLATLRPVYTLRGIPGIPNARVGERVQFIDTHAMSAQREGFLIGINWDFTPEGYRQDWTVLDAEGLFPYSDYFIIGTTALGASPAANTGRCWY
jgi:hypothetical protein